MKINTAKNSLTVFGLAGSTLLLAAAIALPSRLLADGPPATTPSATPAIPHAAAGMPAHDFALKTLDGRTVELSKLRGKAVLLNFWATWCAPCRAEMPRLVELYAKYKTRGLEILGISMDEGEVNRARIAPFVAEMNVSYPILLGDEKVAAAYDGVPLLPTTFFIGRDGRILGSVSGMKASVYLEAGALKALRTKP